MEAEHNGIASQSGVDTGGQRQETFWDDQKAQVVGKTRYWVARCMAQWSASKVNERHGGSKFPDLANWPVEQ
jgi:hypothetical protein